MKRVLSWVALLPLVGCGYLTFEWPPEKEEKPKVEKPKPPATQEKEPEYKPTDFPYFKDDDDKEPMKPGMSQIGPRLPRYSAGYYGYYPWWSFGYWGGIPFWTSANPAWILHEHHNHGTGASTYEWMPTNNPGGWGFQFQHHHH
jgi:hypothetical protein